ncbi:hypothetical protein J2T58_000787 [Methanocalculus alkaliphilus]|nr:hypothetical protein [Methanocalculus alkaliphilus]
MLPGSFIDGEREEPLFSAAYGRYGGEVPVDAGT